MGGSVICFFIKRVVVRYHAGTSEERDILYLDAFSNAQSLITSYHTVTHVIIFLSYSTTPGII